MENGLVKKEVMNLPEIMSMAKTFAESGMFADAKGMAQAFVKIQAGQEIGIPPFAAMSGINIIKGKPTIGAGIMASMVKGSGKYDYKIKELTELNCSLDFYQSGTFIGNSSFSIQDAKKAGTGLAGGMDMIGKFTRNMLFARAISNGVKWFTPDVFSGPVYVPEEMQQTEDIQHEVVNTPRIEKVPEVKKLNESGFQKGLGMLSTNFKKAVETFKIYELTDEQKNILDNAVFEICKESTPEQQYEKIKLYGLPQILIDRLVDIQSEILTEGEKNKLEEVSNVN